MLIIGLLYVLFVFAIRLYLLVGPILFLIGAIQLILGVQSASTLLLIGALSVFITIVLGVSIPLALPEKPDSAIFLTNCYVLFFLALTILAIIFSGDPLILGICCAIIGVIASSISIAVSVLKIADN